MGGIIRGPRWAHFPHVQTSYTYPARKREVLAIGSLLIKRWRGHGVLGAGQTPFGESGVRMELQQGGPKGQYVGDERPHGATVGHAPAKNCSGRPMGCNVGSR